MTGVSPLIHNRDRRCKKHFKYEDYAQLPDLVDALMLYIERVGAERMYKKSKAEIKNDVSKLMNKYRIHYHCGRHQYSRNKII